MTQCGHRCLFFSSSLLISRCTMSYLTLGGGNEAA
jgi:hypothetical protein